MRNFGQPYKNYGPPRHFRFVTKGDSEFIPMYTAPSYGVADKDPKNLKDLAAPAAAVGIVLGVGLLNTFALTPFIIKSFRPDIPYGRRVGIGLGISALAGIARGLIKAAKKD
jgi:hypothetical protein